MNRRRSIPAAVLTLAWLALRAGAQSFDYDQAGRVTRARYDTGASITYHYMLDGSLTNVAVSGSIPEADGDGDSMADAWELVWFNTLTNTASADFNQDTRSNLQHFLDQTDPTDSDSDGDGVFNAEELFAGTRPLDGGHYFRVEAVAAANSFSVSIACTNSRVYSLEIVTNLHGEGWTAIPGQTDRPGETDGNLLLTDPAEGFGGSYRVRARAP